ncbi:Transcription initiation factor TFIID subunit 1 [Acorus gramineus]|uniref:Transcription initiation factor TFIID subunit 1 n=1 Tax=Acorus gramineus TaxID=55184 RepID=A0AAV9A575_ACOGR|nr:Transcription initiation factor TFIID subunit 1 [Acorus gramineus]
MDELGSSSRYHHDEYDEEEDDEDNEEQGGNKLFGFMFGNVDDSGDLDADYLDEDAKEHLSALADKLGSSLTDIDLKPTTPADASEQDYAEKADDAVDYEDIDEQYEGPEIQATTEEDYLLPRKEYFSAEVSLVSLDKRASVFDEENYDEDEDSPKEHMSVENISEPQTSLPEGKQLDLISDQENFFDDNLPSVELSEAADVYHLEDFSEEESEDLEEPSESKDETSLPVLYIEDGMAVLRFSEIFGIHEPLKKQERRDHHRCSIHKDKARTIDVTESIEVDEEMLLKSSFHVPHITGHICLSQYDIGKVKDISMEPPLVHPDEGRKDSCLSALPMKECMSTDDLPVGQKLPSCPEFYPLDYQDWEDSIVWGNSPRVVHESSESSVISGVEADVSTNVEIDVGGVVLQDKEPEFQTGADEKEHNLYLQSYPVSVEAFGSREESEFAELRSLGRCYHPQVLRLDTRMEMKDSHSMEVRKDDGTGLCGSETIQRLTEISSQNKDLLDGSWVDHILWEPNASVPKPKLILDLQDDRMLFEIVDSKDSKQILSRARAMIITRTLKSCPRDSFDLPGHVGPPIGKFDISNDKYYPNRKTSQQLKSHAKKRAVHGIKIVHSAPALKLHTMKPKLSNKEIANFHRPKALWYPHDNETAGKEQGNLCTQGSMNIVVLSIGGKGVKLQVNAEEPVFSVKEKASKKLDYKPSESVKIFYSGKELEDDKSLFIQNVRPNSVLHLVRTKIHMWPRAQKLPGENKSLRPPAAFKKKSELSVKMGHVFLMEYCEERPLLLSNIGMAARIFTYYQKVTLGDQSASSLRNGHSILGNVLTLDPADKSPFLGDIRPGCSQMCLETNLYRAPIFPHKLPSTDYLLVRNAKGMLSLRRIDRIHAVGQQEPHMEVNSPGSKSLQTYLGNRLLAYIYREFHANEKPGYLPCVRATDVTSKFLSLAEPFIRKKLKHCADLQRGPHGQLYWRMRRNFHPPSEEELRRMVTPENVCCYESMQAGLYRLKHLGISRLTHPTNLSYAMDHLPNKAIMLAAASHIERELQITPWNLSSNFVACISQDRENIERLEITGVGDPSGRGLGFSYVRVSPKSSVSSAAAKKKVTTARAGSTLTGTDADLRRISMDAARDILLQLGLKPEDIEKKGRWHRIALIRQLSSEQAASGVRVDMAALGKFARGQRMSFLQLQQQTREKCQEIWDRQVQSLSAADGDENESDTEANSDLDSFAGDLENLLDAEEGEDGVKGDHEPLMSDAESGRELKMRRQLSQAQVDEYREDIEAEAAEIHRLLYDDDNALRKKQKTKPTVKEVRLNMQLGLASHGAEIKKAKDIKHIARAMQPESSFPSKEIAVVKPVEGESFLAKSNFTPEKGKKEMGKKEIIHTGVTRKKSKVIGDVIKEDEFKAFTYPADKHTFFVVNEAMRYI